MGNERGNEGATKGQRRGNEGTRSGERGEGKEKVEKEYSYNSSANPQAGRQLVVDKSPKCAKRGRNAFTLAHLQIAKWLHYMASRHNRAAAKLDGADFNRWANELRLAEKIDEIDLKQATDALTWGYEQDYFWRDVIASPRGLRKHWPKLKEKYLEHQQTLLNH